MAYRRLEPHKKEPNRTMQDTTTPSRLFIDNGATADFAVPCWYAEMRPPVRATLHSRPWHDHLGWPNPDRPDRSCQNYDFAHHSCHKGHRIDVPPFGSQLRHGAHGCGQCGHCDDFIDLAEFFPIHLTAEGYTRVSVSFVDRPEGLTYEAWIDPKDDWIVRVFFSANVDEAVREPQKCVFSVKVHRDGGPSPSWKGGERADIVYRGEIVIIPTPWEEGDFNE